MSDSLAVEDPLGMLITAKEGIGDKMSTETTTETPETAEVTEERTPFTELEELVAEAKVDWLKLHDKGVQVRATKFRKKMQEVRALAKTLRVEALELRKVAKDAATARKAQQAS